MIIRVVGELGSLMYEIPLKVSLACPEQYLEISWRK